jgi:hypothetical protein
MKLRSHHIRDISRQLRRRHEKTGDTGLLGVGIGWAMKRKRPDRKRGRVITYIVLKKCKHVPKTKKIPRKVSVYITTGRGGQRRRNRLVFETDVVELPPAILTGVKCTASGDWFTVGALISWSSPGNNPSWGLLTIGHGVNNVGDQVQISTDTPINGTVAALSSPNDPLDAAIISLNANDVNSQFASVLPPNVPLPPPPRTLEQLIDDGINTHPAGVTHPIDTPQSFVIYAYVPEQGSNPIIPQAPNRQHLLLVQGATNEFDSGTSGSVWTGNQSVPDAIQIAGFPPDMANGIGQSMYEYLHWAQNQSVTNGQPIKLMALF